MLEQSLAPNERIAGIMTRAIEELAEIHIEVAQKGFETIHIRERDAEVAAILASPGFEREDLGIAQSRPQRLTRLQILMTHGAQRGYAVLLCKVVIAGTGEVIPHALDEDFQNFF